MYVSIGNLIADLAIKLNNKKALEDLNERYVTYGDLAEMLAYAGTYFRAQGFDQFTRIAVAADSGLELAFLFLLVSENCVFIPFDPAFSKSKFEKRYELLKPEILIVEKNYEGPAVEAWSGKILRYTYQEGCIRFVQDLKKGVVLGRESEGQSILMLTTSGTTSTPKVVPLTLENLLVSAREKIEFFAFTEEDRSFVLTPFFKGTSINSMLATLLSGGSVLIADEFGISGLIKAIEKHEITWFTASPAVLHALAAHATKQNISLARNSLRFVRSSGAPLKRGTKESLEANFGVPVIQTYGMTETRTIASTYGLPEYKEGSVGISLGSKIKIEKGEILLQGKNVFAGYESNDAANAEAFSEGWFRTGDLGYIDEDGYVFITGRAKEMINRGGEKISPYEVEAAILTVDGITDAAVFPYPNGYGSDDAGAVVVLERGYELTLKELRSQLFGKISPFKMPSLMYVVNEIPLSMSGKVQRRLLFEQLDDLYPQVLLTMNESRGSESKERTMTDTEKRLFKIWKSILNVHDIGLQDNFFDLGGDSLSASELFLAIEEQFQVHVSIDDLFNAATIPELAEIVQVGSKSDFQFLVKIKDGTKGTPIFFIHSGDGQVVTYHRVSRLMKKDWILWGLKFSRKADWDHPLDFDQLAEKYIREIKAVQPTGPYRLIGNCHGGVLAYHLACRLNDQNDKVSLLAMFDPLMGNIVVGKGNFGMRKRLWYALMDVKGRSVADLPAIIAKKTVSFFRVLKYKIQYRLYDRACNGNANDIPRSVSSLIVLKKAKEITELEKYQGIIHYLLPSKTAKGSAPSIAYWETMAKEVKVVEFEGTHNYMTSRNAESLTMKIEEILEKVDD